MDANQVITDLADLRKYRTELPNLYDDLDLDVYEYRLLAHYKRVGTCTEKGETTAKKCRMSAGKVSEARQGLADKGLIYLKRVDLGNGSFSYRITVVDIWLENFARYSGLSESDISQRLQTIQFGERRPASPGEAIPEELPLFAGMDEPASPHEPAASPDEVPASPGERKKKLLIKNHTHKERPNFRELTVTERMKVPEIRDFHEATGIWPGTGSLDYVFDAMRKGIETDKLREVFGEWSARGYNIHNVKGYLDWALNGVPPDKYKERPGKHARSSQAGNSDNYQQEPAPSDLEAARRRQAARNHTQAGSSL